MDNDIIIYNGKAISLNRAKTTFKKPIPFKIYQLSDLSGINAHTHDYIQIWYVMYGCCEHWIGSNCHKLVKGDIFVLPPFVVHEIRETNSDGVEIIGCEFSAGFINENLPEDGERSSLFDFAYLEPFLVSMDNVKPRLHLTGKAQAKVESLMTDMLQEYKDEKKYYELNIKADLLKLLAIIAREYENCGKTENYEIFERYRDAINSAIRYINENYARQIYIDDVCRIAMMSNTYFSHLFKQITGKTFVEYVNNLRIQKAAELLGQSDAPISRICFDVGFNDMAYFYRVFKKETGLSPSQYRKINSGLRKAVYSKSSKTGKRK